MEITKSYIDGRESIIFSKRENEFIEISGIENCVIRNFTFVGLYFENKNKLGKFLYAIKYLWKWLG